MSDLDFKKGLCGISHSAYIVNQFQNNINRVVIKRNEKRAFIELLKIKRLPIELVEKIIKLTY